MDIILAAIDGTSSWTYFREKGQERITPDTPFDDNGGGSAHALQDRQWAHKSHVYRFYQDAQVGAKGAKEYFEGPDISGMGLGSGESVGSITLSVMEFILSQFKKKPRPIAFVGHSRGAAIAVTVAHNLLKYEELYGYKLPVVPEYNTSFSLRAPGLAQIPIVYMGLFDAVDRSFGLVPGPDVFDQSEQIPKNVHFVAHAIRDPGVRSRFWMSNTAMEYNENTTHYVSRYFRATHGATGGAPISRDFVEECSGLACFAADSPAVTLNEREHIEASDDAFEFVMHAYNVMRQMQGPPGVCYGV